MLTWILWSKTVLILTQCIAKSAGAVEYTDCASAEEQDSHERVSWYDTKQSNGEVPVMLELWRIPLLPGPLRPRVVVPDRALWVK